MLSSHLPINYCCGLLCSMYQNTCLSTVGTVIVARTIRTVRYAVRVSTTKNASRDCILWLISVLISRECQFGIWKNSTTVFFLMQFILSYIIFNIIRRLINSAVFTASLRDLWTSHQQDNPKRQGTVLLGN